MRTISSVTVSSTPMNATEVGCVWVAQVLCSDTTTRHLSTQHKHHCISVSKRYSWHAAHLYHEMHDTSRAFTAVACQLTIQTPQRSHGGHTNTLSCLKFTTRPRLGQRALKQGKHVGEIVKSAASLLIVLCKVSTRQIA
jgi:hypothetical protein